MSNEKTKQIKDFQRVVSEVPTGFRVSPVMTASIPLHESIFTPTLSGRLGVGENRRGERTCLMPDCCLAKEERMHYTMAGNPWQGAPGFIARLQ